MCLTTALFLAGKVVIAQEDNLGQDRRARRASTRTTKLTITMSSHEGFRMREVLVKLDCTREPVDLDGKVTDQKGQVTFIVQRSNKCYARGGVHGFPEATSEIEIGTDPEYSLVLVQEIQLADYETHLKNPE
jgi:hypothetical protein